MAENINIAVKGQAVKLSLVLYKNSAEEGRVDKTDYITEVGRLSGYLRKSSNVYTLVLDIQRDEIDFNYIYVSNFNKYYFVETYDIIATRLYSVTLSEDVLFTFKDGITGLKNAFVIRNENFSVPNVIDKDFPLAYNKVIEQYTPTNRTDGVTLSHFNSTNKSGSNVILSYFNNQTQTDGEDVKNNPDIYTLTTLNSNNYSTRSTTHISLLNTASLVELTTDFFNDDTLLGFINNCIIYPFDVFGVLEYNESSPTNDIYLGVGKLTLTNGIYNPVEKLMPYMNIADFYFTRPYDNYLNYSPYTNYEMYLPYFGWIEIDPDMLFDTRLSTDDEIIVTYLPNWINGDCNVFVINKTRHILIYSDCAKLGVTVGFNSSNERERLTSQNENATNVILGTIGSGIIALAGGATGNYGLAYAGVAGMTSSISKSAITESKNYSKGHSVVSSSFNGLSTYQSVKMRITKSVPSFNQTAENKAKYAKVIGLPVNQPLSLNLVHGFTKVGDVHLEDLTDCNLEEVTEIKKKLNEGVILP